MPVRILLTRHAVAGVIAGAIILSMAAAIWSQTIDPGSPALAERLLHFAMPIGAWLGAAVGITILVLARREPGMAAGLCYAASIVVLFGFWYMSGWTDAEVFKIFVPEIAAAVFVLLLGFASSVIANTQG